MRQAMTTRLLAATAALLLLAAPARAFDQAAIAHLDAEGECLNCDLSQADLQGADLEDATLDGADLSGADLSGAVLSAASLAGANLSGANLEGADLSFADLTDADLRGARLVGAAVDGANFTNADLKDADVAGTDFTFANHANLAGALGQPTAATPSPSPAAGKGLQNLLTGTLLLAAFDYCPSGTLEADGRSLKVVEYQPLYVLYGTTYGGDAKAFNLPDLRKRVPAKGLRYCVVAGGTWPAQP